MDPVVKNRGNQGVTNKGCHWPLLVDRGSRHYRPSDSIAALGRESYEENSFVHVPIDNDSGWDPTTGVSVAMVAERSITITL
jgi:hypothetical protein